MIWTLAEYYLRVIERDMGGSGTAEAGAVITSEKQGKLGGLAYVVKRRWLLHVIWWLI